MLLNEKRKHIMKRIVKLMGFIIVICVVSMILGVGKVTTTSMAPTYESGDVILYNKLSNKYAKGDVVIVKYQDQLVFRRIVGVYKDQINIDNTNGNLMINGNVDYSYGTTLTDPTGVKFPLHVSKDQVFVLCDQRDNTADSRRVGCINQDSIVGKVIFKI